jgi:hypothetical protein
MQDYVNRARNFRQLAAYSGGHMGILAIQDSQNLECRFLVESLRPVVPLLGFEVSQFCPGTKLNYSGLSTEDFAGAPFPAMVVLRKLSGSVRGKPWEPQMNTD